MKKRTLVGFLAPLLSGLFFLSASEPPLEQEKKDESELVYQVVVSGSRAPQSSKELGSSLTVLPGLHFGSALGRSALNHLGSVPGLSVTQNGGFGHSASLFIRGANSEHTLVLIDGIEVNDPSSPSRSFDFGTLEMVNIERIEVVRGSQSPLYGSDAIGGVVHIITQGGTKPGLSFSLAAEAGRYSTFREQIGVGGRFKKSAFHLGFSRYDSKGFSSAAEQYGNSEADGSAQNQLHFKGELDLPKRLKLGAIFRYQQGRTDLDTGAGHGGDDPNYQSTHNQWLLALRSDWRSVSDTWQQSLNLSLNQIKRRYDNPVDPQHPSDSSLGIYRANSTKATWQNQIALSSHHDLIAGLEWQREQAESEYRYTSAWGDGSSPFPQVAATTLSTFAVLNLDLGQRLFVNSGLRLDHHAAFGSQLSFKLSPALFLTPTTKLMGAISSGFKAPSLYQLYAPTTPWGPVGNPELAPEKALTLDFGLQQRAWNDRLVLEISYFYNRYRNLIDYDWSQGYINVAKAMSQGLEASMTLRPASSLNINGTYTLTKTRDEATNLALLKRPKHRFTLAATWSPLSALNLSVDLRHTGKSDDIYPYPTRVESKAFTLFSAGLQWRALRDFRLSLRIENIVDVIYEPIVGYGAARRSAYVGADWSF